MDFSLFSNNAGVISLFTTQPGSPSMLEVMTTIGTALAGLVVYRQKAKDTQLAEQDKQIAWLQKQLDKTRDQLDKAQTLVGELRTNPTYKEQSNG